ncbi:MAG: hypothetical protein U9R25_00720 [Chloroflexota bacterium]|nr:hypothetical protein [Chloroflexota bacterium]
MPADGPVPLAARYPVESVVPFSVTDEQVSASLKSFVSGLWFAPGDLNWQNLVDRAEKIFLPRWLVDTSVSSTWNGDAGFDYQVVSHQDDYSDNASGWRSQQITETRIRWEPRAGRLDRIYHNVEAPALEEDTWLDATIGPFATQQAETLSDNSRDTVTRLPDRLPDDAWSDAEPIIRARASEDCQKACQADHWREFDWSPEFGDMNWSMVLFPVYLTHYHDGEVARTVLINGRSGRLYGVRRASIQRALPWTAVLGGLATASFILGLLFFLLTRLTPPEGWPDVRLILVVFGVFSILASVILGFLAFLPLIYVWQVNSAPDMLSVIDE